MDNHDLPPHAIAPINPLPPVVWFLVLPMIALEIAFSLAEAHLIGGAQAIGWRTAAIEAYGVFPEYWRQNAEIGRFTPEVLWRFATYSFIHYSATQAVFAVVILLAMGKFVGEIFRAWAVAAVFFAGAIVGGVVFATFVARQPLFGAYPGVYGLIGAFTFLLWVRLAGTGTNQFRAFSLIGALLFFQLVFGLLFGGGFEWVADLSGFATGFLLSFVVSPGGFARVRDRIRQR